MLVHRAEPQKWEKLNIEVTPQKSQAVSLGNFMGEDTGNTGMLITSEHCHASLLAELFLAMRGAVC